MSQQSAAPLPSDQTGNPLWTLRDVTLNGHRGPRLDRVSLTVPPGRVALLGVSGAGKSSLIRLLADFETADSGQLTFHQTESAAPLPVFWSPQDYGLWPHLTAREHLEHARPDKPRTGVSVDEWLQRFRLTLLAESRPGDLSEGEQSRLSVARALTSEASVLLLDEPLAHVDAMHREDDWRTIMDFSNQFCRGTVFATHDPVIVRTFADHVVSLDRGQVQFGGTVDELLYSPPDRTTAWLLGPCNWLDDESRPCFPGTKPEWQCLRPEETFLNLNSTGILEVTRIENGGAVCRAVLQNSESKKSMAVYVTHNPQVQLNSRVQIEVVPSPRRI